MSKKLPEGWKKSKLIDLCDFSQGIQVAIDNQYNEREEGYVRFLRIVDYTQNKDELRYITYPGDKYMVNSSEVVMIRYGDAGRVVRGHEGAIANNLFKITPKLNHLTNDYLYYFLSQKRIYDMLINSQQKTGLPAVNFRTVYDIEIVYPETLEEQGRIVSILEKAENAIEKREESIKLIDELVKSRFVEMFGDPITNPKGWKKIKLKDTSNHLKRGKSPKYSDSSSIKVINQKCIYWRDFKPENCKYYNEEFIDKIKGEFLDSGDIVINSTGTGTLGRALVLKNIKSNLYVADSHITVMKVNEFVNPIYITTLLEFKNIQSQVYSKCVNGSTNQIELSVSKLGSYKIMVPPIEIQNKFADFVKQVDKLKFEMRNSLKELEDNFNSLMQKAFNGEL